MANLCIKTPSSAILVLIFQLLVLRPRPNSHNSKVTTRGVAEFVDIKGRQSWDSGPIKILEAPSQFPNSQSQFLFVFSGSNRLFFEERHVVPHKKVVLLCLRPLIVTIGISSLFFNLALVSIWNVSIANLQCRCR